MNQNFKDLNKRVDHSGQSLRANKESCSQTRAHLNDRNIRHCWVTQNMPRAKCQGALVLQQFGRGSRFPIQQRCCRDGQQQRDNHSDVMLQELQYASAWFA